MGSGSGPAIAEAQSSGRELTSLPRRYYTSPEVFEEETGKLFLNSWIYVGHESQLPEPGNFFTAKLLGENVIVARDHAGIIHAFYDVCRHRGSRICDTTTHGRTMRFVCPYHQWAYDLDGKLVAAPRMPDFDRSAYPLKTVHVSSWNGFIFANLSETGATPLPAQVSIYRSEWHRYDMLTSKVAHSITYQVGANWKLVMENFLECYHCSGAHKEFCAVFDLELYFSSNSSEFGLREGTKTLTMTGEYVCKRLLTPEHPASGEVPIAVADIGNVFTSSVITLPDYGIVFRFLPITVSETEVRTDWLVHRDAELGRDYNLDELIALWDITNRQDWVLCERNQAGVSSRAYEPGPYNLAGEPEVGDFVHRYLTLMGHGTRGAADQAK
jgi:glycine betaine catabolism A